MRRAFATHDEARLGLLRADTKAILDHGGGEASDVTGGHYSMHNGSHRTWPIARAWAAALEPEIRTAQTGLEDVQALRAAIAVARNGS